MKDAILHKVAISSALFSGIAFTVTGIVSYRAYTLSQDVGKESIESFQTLERHINRIDEHLAKLENSIEKLKTSTLTAQSTVSPSLQHDEITRPKKAVESSGTEQLTALEKLDPEILQEMYNRHAERKHLDSLRQELREKNSEQHEADKSFYGEELNSLYQSARFLRINPSSEEDRENAFKELLTKYPDSYATAMVIAERALISARRRDTQAVEKYYNMLKNNENENFQSVVIDRGIEAMPNIEHSLAWLYFREGRMDDAKIMTESLDKNYTQSLVTVRRRSRGSRLVPVPQALSRLYRFSGLAP